MIKIKNKGNSYSIIVSPGKSFHYKEKKVEYREIFIRRSAEEGGAVTQAAYVSGVYTGEADTTNIERIQVRRNPETIGEMTIEDRLEMEELLIAETGASQILFWPAKLILAIEPDNEANKKSETNRGDTDILEAL